jgi:hypothetical protein
MERLLGKRWRGECGSGGDAGQDGAATRGSSQIGHLRFPFSRGWLEPSGKFALPLGSLVWYHSFVKKKTVQPRKKRGPAPTGKGTPIQVRAQPDMLGALDAWIARQDDQPSRPEAIRRLVELSLTRQEPPAPASALIPLGRRR